MLCGIKNPNQYPASAQNKIIEIKAAEKLLIKSSKKLDQSTPKFIGIFVQQRKYFKLLVIRSTKFLIANEFTAKDGSLRQWVTSGHEVTLAVDGNDIKVNQVHDALIVNGKVQQFTVNERILKE